MMRGVGKEGACWEGGGINEISKCMMIKLVSPLEHQGNDQLQALCLCLCLFSSSCLLRLRVSLCLEQSSKQQQAVVGVPEISSRP